MKDVKLKTVKARLTRRVDINEDLWKIWLSTETPFKFKPGQYCTIGVDGIERPYSIVSSPHEPEIELFIELVPPPDGNLTPLLYNVHVGQEVTLRKRAKGIFVFKPQFKYHLMVATVTGIAPYVSMIRWLIHSNATTFADYNIHVLEGASYVEEFGYHDELLHIAKEYKNVSFLPSISRPDEDRNKNWKGAKGRINTIIEDYITNNNLPQPETVVYACGHPQMIQDVHNKVERLKFHFEEERFWKE